MKRIGVLMLVLLVCVWAQQSKPQTAADKRSTDSNLIVVDDTGRTIGPVIGAFGGGAVVAFPFQGSLLPLEVLHSSFYHLFLYFISSDCTGQPFVDGSASPFPASVVQGRGNTLYTSSGKSQSITTASAMIGLAICFPSAGPLSDVVPVEPALNLDQVFTPPFRVVSQREREKE